MCLSSRMSVTQAEARRIADENARGRDLPIDEGEPPSESEDRQAWRFTYVTNEVEGPGWIVIRVSKKTRRVRVVYSPDR